MAGVASGSAIIPFTVIKEANPPGLTGAATGFVNFVTFLCSAVLGPVFGGLMHAASLESASELAQYQNTFRPLLYGVGLAVVLAFGLKETGPAAREARLTVEGNLSPYASR
jgi:hypothetical protein